MSEDSVFEIFRKNIVDTSGNLHRKAQQFFFQLHFDDAGAFVKCRNDQGEPVDPEPGRYTGALGTVVRFMRQLIDRSDFVVDWEHPSNEIYLHEHGHLIAPLVDSGFFLGPEGGLLHWETDTARLVLRIRKQESDPDACDAAIKLLIGEEEAEGFRFIDDAHLLSNGKVVKVPPVGNRFKALPFFTSSVNIGDLPKFLSIFLSFTENVELDLFGWPLSEGEPIASVPVLIFEKIDYDGALHLRVGEALPGMEENLLNNYGLVRMAFVDHVGQKVWARNIAPGEIEARIQTVSKALHRHIPKKEKKEEETDEGPYLIVKGERFIVPQAVAEEFIHDELPGLLSTFKLMGAENLRSFKVVTTAPKLELRLGHGIDFLQGEASLHLNGEQFSLFDALQQYQRNKYILLSDGTHAIVNQEYMAKLQRLFSKSKGQVQVSFFDLPLVEDMIDEQLANTGLERSRQIFEGFNQIGKSETLFPRIQAELRPYQLQGFHWLRYLHDNGLGGCLADDMGLGKTLQTIALLSSIYPGEVLPSLIVMPRSLLFNWEKELSRFAPSIDFHIYHSQGRDLDEAMRHHLILTTYTMVRNDIEELQGKEFYYVILDESQHIKNVAAQVSRAVLLLNSRHRLSLSGTPIENNLGELYALFRFLNPSMFGSLEHFMQQYANPVQRHNDEQALTDLRKKIYPFVLRRLKKDVLKELPEKIEQVMYVEMPPQHKSLYEQRRTYYQESIKQQIAMKGLQDAKFFVFQALSELRQLASAPESYSNHNIASPKVELLVEQLTDALANGHKALVFVNFVAALQLISEKLTGLGIGHISMSGTTKDRGALVAKFQEDPLCRVFLLTLKTGGTGLNLTAADVVFIFDPWWNRAAENQAIDRSHRMGQKKTVLTYKMIVVGTIEEKILQLQARKADVFDNLISADGASLKNISEEDIDFILEK